MRVLCIDSKNRSYTQIPNNFLVEGNVYTVLDKVLEMTINVMCYELVEDPDALYAIDRFIPVSDIDEKEFELKLNKVKEDVL